MVDNKKLDAELDEPIKKEALEQESQLQQPIESVEGKIEEEKSTELSAEDAKKLREKIENAELDDQLKVHVSDDAQQAMMLEDEKAIQKLMDLAESKGVVYAFAVAKKMDDPYILDTLHDRLSKDGYYKSLQ